MSKHTPGPWTRLFHRGPHRGAIQARSLNSESGYICVAKVMHSVHENEAVANSCLIAAAPILLFAARTVEEYLRCKDMVSPAGIDNMLTLLREAIACAEGVKT